MIQLATLRKNNITGALFLLCFSSLLIQWLVFDFIIPTKLITVVLLYFSVMILQSPYFSAVLIFLLECLLLRINFLKLSHTNVPLDASDILSWKQALFVEGYADNVTSLLIFLMLLTFILGFTVKKRQFLFFPVFLLFTTSCVQERRIANASLSVVGHLFRMAHVTYVEWDFATNIKENGVLNHLFLTLPVGKAPSRGPMSLREGVGKMSPVTDIDGPDIFLILCESCYTSLNDKFETPMARLKNEGFEQASIVSPVYGGMTPEAEFEVLTGLSSQRFKGVDFQDFAEVYSSEAQALPRVLRHWGYRSISAHNNVGSFWHREVVHRKLGFQDSYFIDSMSSDFGERVPRDKVLFDKAFTEYQNNVTARKKTFAFLVTLYTHGPYLEVDGDDGEADYKRKMEISVRDLLVFEQNVRILAEKNKRSVVFLIFGDHKPSMTASFYRRQIFTKEFFSSVGSESTDFSFKGTLSSEQKMIYGEVPLFIKSIGSQKRNFASLVARDSQGKPTYCLPAFVTHRLQSKDEFYGHLRGVCQHSAEALVDQEFINSHFPEELFGNLLF